MDGLLTALAVVVAFSLISILLRKLLPAIKGGNGERRVRRELQKHLPPFRYQLFHDVTLPCAGGTTQIDHIALSSHGLFVIETKNMSGQISGTESQSHWTQSLPKQRFAFQNPLKQNFHHVKVLQNLLGLSDECVHSVVVFTGSSKFGGPMPSNVVRLNQLTPHLLSKTDPLIPPSDLQRLADLVESNRLEPGAATDAMHVDALRHRHAGSSNADSNTVGSSAVPRQSPRTANLAVGAAMMAVLLMAGGLVYRQVAALNPPDSAVASGSSVITQTTASASTMDNAGVMVPESASQSTVSPAADTRAVLAQIQLDAMALREEFEARKQPQRESSLECAWSEDTGRCACYEPGGTKADVQHDFCKTLASEGSILQR